MGVNGPDGKIIQSKFLAFDAALAAARAKLASLPGWSSIANLLSRIEAVENESPTIDIGDLAPQVCDELKKIRMTVLCPEHK